jgi:hypothetical protein
VPLGETIAPQVWVHQRDAARAKALIAEWANRPQLEPADDDDEAEDWYDQAEQLPPESEEGPLPSDVRFRWFSQGFCILGVACALFAAIWAWHQWTVMRILDLLGKDDLVRQMTQPGWILALSIVVGGFLFLVGYQFR